MPRHGELNLNLLSRAEGGGDSSNRVANGRSTSPADVDTAAELLGESVEETGGGLSIEMTSVDSGEQRSDKAEVQGVVELPESRPGPSGDEENEDDQQRKCPSSFWLTRSAARILAPKRSVEIIVLFCIAPTGLIATVCPRWASDDSWFTWNDQEISLDFIHNFTMGLAVFFTVFIIPSLRFAVVPRGGLYRLGAGTRMIHKTRFHLDRWALLLSMVAVGLFVMFMFQWVHRIYVSDTKHRFTPGRVLQIYVGQLLLVIAVPLFVAWYLTLKVAAALVVFRVDKATQSIQVHNPASPQWQILVEDEIRHMIMETLPLLSNVWGKGALSVCLTCWTLGFAIFAQGLEKSQHSDTQGFKNGWYSEMPQYIFAFFISSIPAAVLWDVASASTQFMLLVEKLNTKRVENPDNTAHAAIYKLEVMLMRLNHGQGPGFTVFGTTISKAFLSSTFAKSTVLLSTVFTSLFALRSASDTSSCELSDTQQEAFDQLLSTLNTSCVVRQLEQNWCLTPAK
jgi:hypothetical protein